MKKLLTPLCTALLVATIVPAQAAPRKSGDYSEVYAGELTTLNYMITGSENAHIMFANTIDNLVEYDRYGILRPSLAQSWSPSKDGLTWTFKLRPGLKWLSADGKEYAEVSAQDWVDSAKYILTKANASEISDVLTGVLKNSEKFFKGELTDFAQVGVKAVDKYTLEYTLEKNVPYFLSMLTYVSFLPVNGKFLAETGAKFGTSNKNILYNGAYLMSEYEPQTSRELVKNDKYWDAGNVHIKRLSYKYNKEAGTLSPELFLRGDVSEAIIQPSILESWMKDPAKKILVHPATPTAYTYFYAFNFSPKFEAQYEPDNWKVAVNNKAFRKAIYQALDLKAAALTTDPYNPESRLQTTITPKAFAAADGKDYTTLGPLGDFAKTHSFDKTLALKFKGQAQKELAGKAKWPVKILLPYNAGSSEWANRSQVVEQQLEGLLGKDFIDVIPVSFPATGFLNATRRAGNFALQECNWGPDYADPETYTDPFVSGTNYNRPEFAIGYTDANGKPKYDNLVNAAKAEVTDLKKRYNLFAKAEAFLIGEAFVIPYSHGVAARGASGGYVASKLEPFTSPFAPFGVSILKFKGQVVLDRAMTPEQFAGMAIEWEKERAAALRKAK
jgi:oligopeptide transport system substrate-binding protein